MSSVQKFVVPKGNAALPKWEQVTLGDIAQLYQPVTISARDLTDTGFPVYGANGIVGFYNKANHETDQVTITCRGSTCGTVNLARGPSWITGNAMVANVDSQSNIDKSFFYQLLKNQDFTICITGTGQPQIVRGPLRDFPLRLPPLNEQQAIATALSDADRLIEALESLIAKKRAVKQGAMQELLSGHTRLPGFSGEWAGCKFGAIAKIRDEKINTYRASAAEFCVELEQIDQGTSQLLGHSDARDRMAIKYAFKAGDVLFGRLRPYLRKYWIANCDGVCSTEIWPLIPKSEELDSTFLAQVVKTEGFIEAASSSYGTHMPRSDWKALAEYKVPLPMEPNEQRAIATALFDMDDELAALETRLAKARAIKQGMMQELLTGRVRLV